MKNVKKKTDDTQLTKSCGNRKDEKTRAGGEAQKKYKKTRLSN